MMGKNPTRRQRHTLKSLGLNPSDWLVCKDSVKELLLKNRHTDAMRAIPKELIRS